MGVFELIGNVAFYVVIIGVPLFFIGRSIKRKLSKTASQDVSQHK